MRLRFTQILVVSLPIALLGGCPGVSIDLPGGGQISLPGISSNVVYVEVWNDTDFEVAPRVYFDDADGFWEQLISSSEELATGTLRSGELPSAFPIDCDRVNIIYSDSAGQFFLTETIGQAGRTRVLEKDDDFDCGDTIRFRYVGEGDGFGVIVSVNGSVVD